VAAVQLRPGSDATPAELLDRCRTELARYKVPERLVLVEGFPRTPMGKIRKRDLPDLVPGSQDPVTRRTKATISSTASTASG
jgi:acyl-CoA synthetase (AMP-forming)/AMP-acid ligase II